MMYLLILVLPFSSAILAFLMGRFIGKIGVIQISVVNLLLSWFLTGYLLVNSLSTDSALIYTLGLWIGNVGAFEVHWAFQFDILSLCMIFVVLTVSTLVHIYSWNYMQGDPFIIRFLGLLSLFTSFMLILVSSTNLIQLFLGWEGIGLCSYFLIGFWYTRVQANKSALKAIIVNRVGDIALLIAISAIVLLCQTVDFDITFALLPLYASKSFYFVGYEVPVLDFISFWLMLAAVGKSAQIGLHTWLPDAMEGPTPVSALIHAATMVTAGIFLIIRCSFIFEYAPRVLLMVTLIGSITTIFAATAGLFQNDIKKVIAYSTCSQLGYMFYACGLSNYIGSFFHLTTHAFFKALLFLSAGSVIHAMLNEQDMRKMGGLSYYIPVTYSSFLIGSLALGGVPFLSGFYSKDFILETAFFSTEWVHNWGFILSFLTAICTVVYSTRVLYLVFWSPTNAYKGVFSQVHESSWFLLIPLLVLSLFSILFGYITKDFFIGAGNQFFIDSIYYYPKSVTLYDVENLLGVKNVIFYANYFIAFSSVGWMWLLVSGVLFNVPGLLLVYSSGIFKFWISKWYFDYIYFGVLRYLFSLCYSLWVALDKGLLEILQPIAFTSLINHLNFYAVKSTPKLISFYFFCFIFSLLSICIIFYLVHLH